MQSNLKLIPQLPFPESLKREMPSIQDAMMATWKKKESEWDFTSGYVPRPELDHISDIYWEVFGYIDDINEVIDHLNIVIRDLNFLSSHPDLCNHMLGGEVSTRFNLLARTFFYELFRTKEIHNRFLKYLRRKSVLRKLDVEEYKKEFSDLFDAFIKLRNKMVHDIFVFPGIEHQNLFMTEFAAHHNMAFKSLKTGEILTTKDAISKVCEEFIEMGLSAGDGLVEYFKTFSHVCCQVVDWIREGKVKLSKEA